MRSYWERNYKIIVKYVYGRAIEHMLYNIFCTL